MGFLGDRYDGLGKAYLQLVRMISHSDLLCTSRFYLETDLQGGRFSLYSAAVEYLFSHQNTIIYLGSSIARIPHY